MRLVKAAEYYPLPVSLDRSGNIDYLLKAGVYYKVEVAPCSFLRVVERIKLSASALGAKELRTFIKLQDQVQSPLLGIRFGSLNVPGLHQAKSHTKQLLFVP